MRSLARTMAAAALAATLAAGSAGASTEISGDADIDVRTGHVTTVGIGAGGTLLGDGRAVTSIGTVHDGVETGDVEIRQRTGHVTTIGIGRFVRGCTAVGSMGAGC